MELSYKRETDKSFMIMEGEACDTGFEKKMIEENEVSVLLPFYIVGLNAAIQVWQDITGKRSLRDYVEQEGVSFETIIRILSCLKIAEGIIRDYLISPEHVSFAPDTVFFGRQRDTTEVYLCYCPIIHSSHQEELSEIMNLFIEKADPAKMEIVKLCYQLYEMSQHPSALNEFLELAQQAEREEKGESHQDSSYYCSEPLAEDCDQSDYRDSYQSDYTNSYKSDFTDPDQPDYIGSEFQKKNRLIKKNISDKNISKKLISNKMNDSKKMNISNKMISNKKNDPNKKNTPSQDGPLTRIVKKYVKKLKQYLNIKFPYFSGKRKKMEGDDYSENDFIYDPKEVIQEPTVYLAGGDDECIGRLIYEGTGSVEKDYTIEKELFKIGSRDTSNDANLHSSSVSRHHAQIKVQGGKFFLSDLNSTNGTYVNGILVGYHEPVELKRRDHVTFADVRYEFI